MSVQEEVGYIYKIDVEGMNILEYYEFDVKQEPDEVRRMWLRHAAEKVGMGVFKMTSKVNVEEINDPTEAGLIQDGGRLPRLR